MPSVGSFSWIFWVVGHLRNTSSCACLGLQKGLLCRNHVISQILDCSEKNNLKTDDLVLGKSKSRDHLSEGNQLAEDQPEVDHLQVGGGGQSLHHTDEDGRHDQHVGQVHRQSGLEVDRLEEGGGKGDQHEKEGGQVGGHHLAHDLPSQGHGHPNSKMVFSFAFEI